MLAASVLQVDWPVALLILLYRQFTAIPFILLFIRKIFEWMKNTRFVKLIHRLEGTGPRKSASVTNTRRWDFFSSSPFRFRHRRLDGRVDSPLYGNALKARPARHYPGRCHRRIADGRPLLRRPWLFVSALSRTQCFHEMDVPRPPEGGRFL